MVPSLSKRSMVHFALEVGTTSMLKVTSQRIFGRVNINLSPVFFDWQGVAPKFFAMVHDALSDDIAMGAGDFSVFASNNLGEVVARYNIFGGPNNVALNADRLSMEFPNLVPEDSETVLNIVGKIVSSFRQSFPDHKFASVQAGVSGHGAIPDEVVVTDYLARYAIESPNSAFGDVGTVLLPGARFGVSAADGTWRAYCTLEQSRILANGLFADFNMDFSSVDDGEEFQHWFDRLVSVREGCMGVLDLEW